MQFYVNANRDLVEIFAPLEDDEGFVYIFQADRTDGKEGRTVGIQHKTSVRYNIFHGPEIADEKTAMAVDVAKRMYHGNYPRFGNRSVPFPREEFAAAVDAAENAFGNYLKKAGLIAGAWRSDTGELS